MADYGTFVAGYPEFAATDQAQVALKLAEATRQVDVAFAGVLADDLIYLLTAQKLARSPFGNSAKTSMKDPGTVYDAEIARIRADITGGIRAT